MSERLMMPTTGAFFRCLSARTAEMRPRSSLTLTVMTDFVAIDETGRSRAAATSVPNSVELLCASSAYGRAGCGFWYRCSEDSVLPRSEFGTATVTGADPTVAARLYELLLFGSTPRTARR